MSTLVVLNYITCDVLFIDITDEMAKSLEEDYENDTEAWLSESGLEKKFGFSVSNSNWMLVDHDETEMFYCNPENGEMVRVFTTM
jgi:hypothetical protein